MSKAKKVTGGDKFPYDAPDSWWQSSADEPPPPPVDWAHLAARRVLYDLCDRRGIKNGFRDVDEEVRTEIAETLAEIIRETEATRS